MPKGLSPAQAKRLTGSTLEGLDAGAEQDSAAATLSDTELDKLADELAA